MSREVGSLPRPTSDRQEGVLRDPTRSGGDAATGELPGPPRSPPLPIARGSRIAAAFVAAGGGLIIVGSVLPWALFDFLFSLYDSSGLDLGYGWVTLVLGFGITALAMTTAVGRGSGQWRWRLTTVFAVGALVIVIWVAGLMYLRVGEPSRERSPGPFFVSHEVGLSIVGIGAAVATIACTAVKRRQGAARARGRPIGDGIRGL
jgi:hypothetical protein